MKNLNASWPPNREAAATLTALELPDGAAFDSRLPSFDPDAFLRLSASLLPQLADSPGFWSERRERAVDCEFDLLHPERVGAIDRAEVIMSLLDLHPLATR